MQPDFKSSSRQDYEIRINRAMDFIQEHLDQPLSLESIAQAACFSPYHFHRIFYALTDETVHDFVWRRRAEAAVSLLRKQPSLPITEVALRCGYSSPSNFAKALKKQFGLSATNIRNFENKNSKRGEAVSTAGEASFLQTKYTSVGKKIRKKIFTGVIGQVKIIDFPQTPIAYVRVINGYRPVEIVKSWIKLGTWAEAQGLFDQGSVCLGVSHDDPNITPHERCRYDAAVTLPEGFRVENSFNTAFIPEGKCAVYHFKGPVPELKNAYYAFYFQWLPNSGYRPMNFPPFHQFFPKDMIKHPFYFSTDIHILIQPL
jgi:AraC family transcriptional regulator